MYLSVQEKEDVRKDMQESLQHMLEKLERFVKEAEINKQKEIEKRKLIIEKR